MPELPSQPQKLAAYHRLNGGAAALLSVYDALTEILVFDLDTLYRTGTKDFETAASVIEGVKHMIATNQATLVERAIELLEE
jgi:hypothetical protein